MSDTFFIKQNDTLGDLIYDLTDSSGSDVDITGASVVLNARHGRARTNLLNRVACEIVSTSNPARVKYSPQPGDFPDPADDVKIEFEVTFLSGRVQTFPNDRLGMPLRVTAELG